MDLASDAQGWRTIFSVVAEASAALTGLLFVAVSLNVERILLKAPYRGRAREALVGLMLLVLLSVLVLIPGQSRVLLGWELVAFGAAMEVFGTWLQRNTVTRLEWDWRRRWLVRLIPIHLSKIVIVVAGVTLLLGRYGGLYWLIPTVLFCLVWSTADAWALVVQAAHEEPEG